MSYKCEICNREFNNIDDVCFFNESGKEVYPSENQVKLAKGAAHIRCIPCADEIKYKV